MFGTGIRISVYDPASRHSRTLTVHGLVAIPTAAGVEELAQKTGEPLRQDYRVTSLKDARHKRRAFALVPTMRPRRKHCALCPFVPMRRKSAAEVTRRAIAACSVGERIKLC